MGSYNVCCSAIYFNWILEIVYFLKEKIKINLDLLLNKVFISGNTKWNYFKPWLKKFLILKGEEIISKNTDI